MIRVAGNDIVAQILNRSQLALLIPGIVIFVVLGEISCIIIKISNNFVGFAEGEA